MCQRSLGSAAVLMEIGTFHSETGYYCKSCQYISYLCGSHNLNDRYVFIKLKAISRGWGFNYFIMGEV